MRFRFPEQMFPYGEGRFWLPLLVVALEAIFPEVLFSLSDGKPWPLDRIDYASLKLSTNMGINYTSWSFYLENGVFAAPFRIGPAILSGIGILPIGWEIYTFLRLAMSPYSYVRAFFAIAYAQIFVIGVCELIVYRRYSDDAIALCISLIIVALSHCFIWLGVRQLRHR